MCSNGDCAISKQPRKSTKANLLVYLMSKKFIIAFLFCILAFIVSEYFLLQEIYADKRPPVLIIAITGILVSLITFLILYKKYRKVAI
jgi:hypothetical protein